MNYEAKALAWIKSQNLIYSDSMVCSLAKQLNPKLEQTTKDYGGGSGSTRFESDLFNVSWWNHQGGTRKRTVLTMKSSVFHRHELCFDGHIDLDNDELCMAQLSVDDLTKMMSHSHYKGKREGKQSLQNAIKVLLDIPDY